MLSIAGFVRRTPALKKLIKPIYHFFVPKTRAQEMNVVYDKLTERIVRNVVKDGDCCVDVGCHVGEIMDIFIDASPKGSHHGFEPIPELASYLRRKFNGSSSVTIHEIALAAEPGRTTFFHNVGSPAFSGLRSRFGHESVPAERAIEVHVDTLDRVLSNARIRLIKIDVEGAELGVLQGATKTIGSSAPTVIFEFGIGGADFFGTTPESIHDFFSGIGYSLYPLDEATTEPLPVEALKQLFVSNEQYYFCGIPAGSLRPF